MYAEKTSIYKLGTINGYKKIMKLRTVEINNSSSKKMKY